MDLLTAAQMRAIEQAAIVSGEVTGLELMERAGQGVVDAIFAEWPELSAQAAGEEGGAAPDPLDLPRNISGKMKAVVLCGPGNNGGDGFVVARLLKQSGWAVKVFMLGEAGKLPPDAKANCDRWSNEDVVHPIEGMEASDFWPMRGAVFVDALFGTGFRGNLPKDILGVYEFVLDEVSSGGESHFVAVDIPSGLSADTGVGWQECVVPAHLTVTFHQPKVGHFLSEGPALCGAIYVADIGLPSSSSSDVVKLVETPPLALSKGSHSHKYSHGHALVLSGGHGKTGAARLAARGALRIGAGLVTLGSPRSAMHENAAQLTAIMLHQIDGAHGVSELLEDPRFNALCLGPGLGRGMDTQAVVIAALKARRATVLDADALTRFERDPQVLFELLHKDCVLTPHAGEFAKLFPDLAEKLSVSASAGPDLSKVQATRQAAVRAGCIVLFKGADTVVADPSGRCSVSSAHYERAAPWLATAGSGDVLAGLIAGLLARGIAPMQAAEMAAWLHVDCALEFGPGLISEDLPEQLPSVLRKLQKGGRA